MPIREVCGASGMMLYAYLLARQLIGWGECPPRPSLSLLSRGLWIYLPLRGSRWLRWLAGGGCVAALLSLAAVVAIVVVAWHCDVCIGGACVGITGGGR